MDRSPKKLTAKKRRKLADRSFRNTPIHGGDRGNTPIHGNKDAINELPHRVLSSIISLLPVKQAVATSAVCRNWRNLWRYLVRLDINVAPTAARFMCQSHSIQCPNLSVLRTSNSDPDILSRFSGLMGSQIWSFHNLRELSCSLNLDKWSDLILLRYIFRASQNLQYLDIISKVNEHGDSDHQALPYPQLDFWKGEETDRLKVVHIRGFQCREKEMLMVSHFINNEESLVKLAIQFDPMKGNSKKKNSIRDAKRELSLLERASKGASHCLQ